jgi:hypothetical protein
MSDIRSDRLEVNMRPIENPAPDHSLNVIADEIPLAVGTYIFRLRVVDNQGNQSKPADWRILVKDPEAPTARITARTEVFLGENIALSGESSTDVGDGRIVTYIWTLVQRP